MKRLHLKVFIFTIIFLSFSCITNNTNEPMIKIACVGDSITYGWGIKDRKQYNFPGQLETILGNNYDVENFGIIGATLLKKGVNSYNTERRIDKIRKYNPDIIIIQLGTNDSKRKNWKYHKEFIKDYTSLINNFKQFDKNPYVIICAPPSTYKNIWDIRENIIKTEIVSLVNYVAETTDVDFIDLHPLLKGHRNLFVDRIHPNSDGSKIIAESIAESISAYIYNNNKLCNESFKM